MKNTPIYYGTDSKGLLALFLVLVFALRVKYFQLTSVPSFWS